MDERVKAAAARYAGKEGGDYEFGDLSKELDRRIKERVGGFTNKESYEFGDISREILRRREAWVDEMQSVFWADDYQFGAFTKKMVKGFTGKEEYKFGDISRTIGKKLFGGK